MLLWKEGNFMKKVLVVLIVLIALFVGVFVGSNITTETHIKTHSFVQTSKPISVMVTNHD